MKTHSEPVEVLSPAGATLEHGGSSFSMKAHPGIIRGSLKICDGSPCSRGGSNLWSYGLLMRAMRAQVVEAHPGDPRHGSTEPD
jgi:hypothetical protein